MSILVVGSVAFDSIETPFGQRDRILGGSATYFSVASSFFTDVKVIAVVGGDFGPKQEIVFTERDIDISGLERIPDGKTFYYSGVYGFDLNDRRTLVTDLNVFANFKPQLDSAARQMPYLFLGNIDPALQLEVRRQMAQPGLVALDTMNYWIEGTREALLRVLREIDVLIINDSEARQLAEAPNLVKAAQRIRQMGPKTLIIKRGEYGAIMFDHDAFFAVPGLPLENVFDPTGAGDAFAGGFLGYLAAAHNFDPPALRQAVIYGSVMASFSVEEFGCERLRRLNYDDINARFRQFKQLVHFEEIEFRRSTYSASTATTVD
ncbi:MAG: sugar kinase [Acidobacteria bacterium]|nr:sugar kinase [Acidobacteriota bacterium]